MGWRFVLIFAGMCVVVGLWLAFGKDAYIAGAIMLTIALWSTRKQDA